MLICIYAQVWIIILYTITYVLFQPEAVQHAALQQYLGHLQISNLLRLANWCGLPAEVASTTS